MANAENISLGPGRLYVAPVGTTAPTTLTEAIAPEWEPVGYTAEGSEFSFEVTTEPVTVAEELEPLFYRTTGRNGTVSFAMAENTARNLSVAFNGGTVNVDSASGEVTYEPPAPGTEERRALLFESEDGEERWVWFKTFQGGTVSMARRQGSEKTTLPVEMRVEKPSSGAPFRVILAGSREA